MRARPRTTTGVLLLLLTLAAPLHAQDLSRWRGTYRRDADASDSLKKIVGLGLARLGKIYRVWPISSEAKRRLADTNRPFENLEIRTEGDSLTTVTEFYTLETPLNGVRKRWERRKNDFIDVTTRTDAERLEQTFDAEDGRRVNVYTLSPDGATLTLDVTVTSPKLSSPLTYRQVFRRVG